MDFFRKLFPIIKRKNMAHNINNANELSDKLTLDQNSQLDNSLNAVECNFINENRIQDNECELDCNKILCTLENVDPIKICPNISQNRTKYIKITGDVPEDVLVLDNEVKPDKTSNNAIQLNKEALATENIDKMSNENGILNDITQNTDKDDETLQNLREFEENLNNFRKTACLSNESAGEPIDLDEFYDIFDKLDTFNEDLDSQINEQNSETAVCNNTLDITKNITGNVNKLENESKILDNIDIVSINSSNEDEKSLANDVQETISINSSSQDTHHSECDGYNSSDFEFITETEAKMDGFIINFRQENIQENDKLSHGSFEPLSSFLSQAIEESGDDKNDLSPGEGPSGLNRQKHEFEDRTYRNNHVIPVGDDYLGLFQGIYNPLLPVSEIFFLENKSIRASAMNVQYDGIGFDKQLALRRPQRDSSEDEFEDEAKESAKKILNMYPGENRKRRRRY